MPIFGYVPFLFRHDPYVYKALVKLSKIYGLVVGFVFDLFPPVISVCGYDAIKEALHNPDLDGRFGADNENVHFILGDHQGNKRRRKPMQNSFSDANHHLLLGNSIGVYSRRKMERATKIC